MRMHSIDATIYLLDDDASIRECFAEALELGGYTVRDFADAESLFAVLETQRPDLLITDYHLGDHRWNGLGVTRVARGWHLDLPVILATALGDVSGVVKAEGASRPDVVLQKPVSMDELLGAVRKALTTDDRARPRNDRAGGGEVEPFGATRGAQLPCDHCESDEHTTVLKTSGYHFVACQSCGATGPRKESCSDAISRWLVPRDRLAAVTEERNSLRSINGRLRYKLGRAQRELADAHDAAAHACREARALRSKAAPFAGAA